jgi:hypothetical protein
MTNADPNTITSSDYEQKVEDALVRIREYLYLWHMNPGRIVVSFRMTRYGWTDDWMARYEPDPTCASCGQHIEDPASAPVS